MHRLLEPDRRRLRHVLRAVLENTGIRNWRAAWIANAMRTRTGSRFHVRYVHRQHRLQQLVHLQALTAARVPLANGGMMYCLHVCRVIPMRIATVLQPCVLHVLRICRLL